ncbi:MAG: DUF2760 domain-containing protein [Gemmataceae bacterium]|nr:DUF2760 domain-containing protein [Gemmataceae bacterium]
MDPSAAATLGVIGTLIVVGIGLFLAAGGDTARLGLAYRCLRDEAFRTKVQALLVPPKPTGPPKPSGVPVRVLALLQREGRLLDFLLENVQPYSDEQIGAAVRDIHRQCQAALKEKVIVEPVLPQAEGETVQVPAGFDPSAIRLTGNVTGQPPFSGTLRHHGWRVKELKLAAPPEGQDEMVLMPAEVELT